MISPLLLALTLTFSGELPGDSLYQLEAPLELSSGAPGALDVAKGHPVLVTLFYARCRHTCPMLVSAIQRVERALSDEERARLRVLLVSLDPARDAPAALRDVIARHGLDEARWSLARPRAGDLSSIAGALGIRYRALPDGEVNHTAALVLLDPEGRVVARTTSLAAVDPAFLDAVRTLVRSK